MWEAGWGSGPGPPQSAPAENRRSGIAEPDREQHRGQPIEEAVAFGGERDEAFEARLADLDVARRDRDDPPLADQIGFGAIIADRHPRRHRDARAIDHALADLHRLRILIEESLGSETRRVGKECFNTGRSRWSPYL